MRDIGTPNIKTQERDYSALMSMSCRFTVASQDSVAACGSEFAPIEAEIDYQQRGEGEGDDADRRQYVAEMAPVCGYEVQNPAGDESKRDRIRPSHPLAMLDDLTVARGYEGGGSADHPGSSLHRGSREAGTTPGESNPREGTKEDGCYVDASKDAMELEVPLTDSRGKIDGAD